MKIVITITLLLLVPAALLAQTATPTNTPTATPTITPYAPWPMLQNNSRHTGNSPYSRLFSGLGLKWSYITENNLSWSYYVSGGYGCGIYVQPTIDSDGNIYCGGFDSILRKYSPAGTQLWSFYVSGFVDTAASLDSSGRVYIVTDDAAATVSTWAPGLNGSNVYCINSNCSQAWSYYWGYFFSWSSPVIDSNGYIYIGQEQKQGQFFCFNSNGTVRWSYDPTNGTDAEYLITGSPALDSLGLVYFSTSQDNLLYALMSTGTMGWSYTLDASSFATAAIDDANKIYITTGTAGLLYDGPEKGSVYAFNSNGTVVWSYKTADASMSCPAFDIAGNHIYIVPFNATYGDSFKCLSSAGLLSWSYKIPFEWQSPGTAILNDHSAITDAGNHIYGGGYSHYFTAINSNATLWWSYRVAETIKAAPAISSGGDIIFGDFRGILYSLGDTTITSTPTPPDK